MAGTKAPVKILFVGSEHICRQVAYVLDIKDYALAEKLTAQNFDQYRDYQIYVCEFKKKSGKLVYKKLLTSETNIRYLDDICRAIDEEYYANRERHTNELNAGKANTQSVTAKSTVQATKVTTEIPAQDVPTKQPLILRIRRGMKHPLRAAWHVVLRVKENIRRRHSIAKKRQAQRKRIRKQQKKIRQQIRAGNLNYYLQRIKPSELLLYVLQAPINQRIQCTYLETHIHIYDNGDIRGCCSAMVPFGNLLRDGELNEIYNSKYARIVKLSSLNGSYCLCNLNHWCKGYCSNGKVSPTEHWGTIALPNYIALSFDPSCNLCCKSCRNQSYVLDDPTKNRLNIIVEKLSRSGYLDQAQKLMVAGMGEVFYSPYYRQLITADLQRQQIKIKSNGILFNQSNWNLVAGKYVSINVEISVDAATAETYQELRGASFDVLMRNLKMLSDLRRQQQIAWFGLSFVVQRDNFREMPEFVKLGRSLGVDRIQFQRLNNLGSFTSQEFLERCLIIDNKYLDYELWCVLQDPIFKDSIVDLQGLQRYIDASERRYRKRYEQEWKGRSA